jgi:hypothetical protein
MIPEDSEKRNDVIDFLIDGMQDIKSVEQEDGSVRRETEFNPEIAWYKGHMINQPFGRHALMIKQVENLAREAQYFMSPERAEEISSGILSIVESYKRSIDAKSSETYKDANNNQTSLVQLLGKNKQERMYTVKGDAKKTFMDGLLGRDGQAESEE